MLEAANWDQMMIRGSISFVKDALQATRGLQAASTPYLPTFKTLLIPLELLMVRKHLVVDVTLQTHSLVASLLHYLSIQHDT